MSNADLLPSLLYKINQNQLALEAAIMELTLWVEQRGSGDVAVPIKTPSVRCWNRKSKKSCSTIQTC
ncbi:hypothetical protein [Pseudomonas sp. BIC9C]|uniref:hypothetical protein n=1 Tax=Pseudomonas sp. BIC9C TaxID=3078458 RepID=UPI002AD54765|nr:hypothetical protein [Pseudomonas sp. BIC9C]